MRNFSYNCMLNKTKMNDVITSVYVEASKQRFETLNEQLIFRFKLLENIQRKHVSSEIVRWSRLGKKTKLSI